MNAVLRQAPDVSCKHMTDFPYINISKSIESEWLKFENKWFRFQDLAGFVMAPLAIIITIFVIYLKNFDITNQNDRAFGFFVLPVVVLACLYAIYRKIFEARLSKLNTSLSMARNKELIKDFLLREGLSVFFDEDQLIVGGAEESLSINHSRVQVYIFLFSEKTFWFTMLKLYSKGNPPVFIDHLLLKRDLRKFFADKYQ
jgi:hypothetical protein